MYFTNVSFPPLTESPHTYHGERILASPGAGVISGSAFRKRASLPGYSSGRSGSGGTEGRPPSGIAGKPPPCLATNTKIYDSDEMFAQRVRLYK